MSRPLANVFLIGGCRSGTTALGRFIGAHPDAVWCKPHTPGFFATDFEKYRYLKSLEDYHACFGEAPERRRIVGEGSTWYLYSARAVPNILEYNPAARFLAIVRNPIEQIQSFHRVMVAHGDEDIVDFEQAWERQEARRAGQDVPVACREPAFLQYGEVARFGSQLRRVIELTGRERMLVTVYDDFVSDPARCYARILDFLGLPHDGRTDFPVANPSRTVRSPALARLAHKPSGARIAVVAAVKRALGLRNFGFSDLIYRINSRVEAREGASPAMLGRLRSHFRVEIDLLSDLLDRDLSPWCAEAR